MSDSRDVLRGLLSPVAVALSGGPDSAAAAALAVEFVSTVRCLHVDHGLPTSHVMREAALRIATALDLEIEVLDVQPSSASETALREARYEALIDRLVPNEILVTGHTSDDQVETVLINLFRGSGPSGLAGIPATRGPILRPFLELTRAELRRIATSRALPFVDDPENQSDEHLRNRIRNQLLPLLEQNYQPAVRTTLSRTARNMSDAAEIIERAVSRVPLEKSPSGVRASMGRMVAVDPTVRRQAIRSMLTHARSPLSPTEAEVDRVEAVFGGGGQTELEGTDARVFVHGPWLYVASVSGAPAGDVALRDGTVWRSFRFSISEPGPVHMSRWRLVTNARSLGVRSVASDDEIAIRGGSKSAVQAIRERGFEPDAHPVVVRTSGELVWIPGVRHAWGPLARAGQRASGYFEIVADEDSPWEPFEP